MLELGSGQLAWEPLRPTGNRLELIHGPQGGYHVFGRVRFRGGLPAGLIAVLLGTILSWVTGLVPVGQARAQLGLHVLVPVIGELVSTLRSGTWLQYLSIIVPMALFDLIGSLQNVESAEAAGDSYPTRTSLIVNGLGTLLASCLGSCFPATIYIGHPGWKALGARAGYSILNGIFVTIVCLTGTLGWISWAVPIDAGMAIVLWIGIVITAQAFQATPREHAPAAVIGLLPGVAAWGALMAKSGLRAAGIGNNGTVMGPNIITAFRSSDLYIDGAFALEQGFIFTSMLLAASTVCVIERRFRHAAMWCLGGAFLSAIGLIHSFRFTPADTVVDLHPAKWYAFGYTAMAVCFMIAEYVTEPVDGDAH